MRNFIFLFLLISTWGCTEQNETPKHIQSIEEAHKRTAFLDHDAIQFRLRLYFGDKERLNARLTLTTDSRKGRLELENGENIYYIDHQVYHSPGLESNASTRFDAYTWSYFFLFPYKLSDEGTQWSVPRKDTLRGTTYNRQKLEFKAGTGDAPDDWYIVYTDPEAHMLRVAAYIVTANKSIAEAEEDPHAIEYLNYENVEGIPVARNWRFWRWREKDGLTEQLGRAELSELKFITPSSDFFRLPVGSIETE